MEKIELAIQNEKVSSIRLICILLVIFNGIFFLLLIINKTFLITGYIGLALIVLYLSYRIFDTNKLPRLKFDGWILLLLAFVWLPISLYIFLAELVLFFLYYSATAKKIYAFSEKLIKEKNFPWRKYDWNELSNVILKDDILTMDFRNNKLIQLPVEQNTIVEHNFNNFAAQQLQHANNQS
jgi:hypothetical protein